MCFNTCINFCNHHYNQDTEQFHHPKELLCATPYILLPALSKALELGLQVGISELRCED